MSRRGRIDGPALVLDFTEIADMAPYICRVLMNGGVRADDLDDVAQDVLLGAWKSIQAGRFRPPPDVELRAAVRAYVAGVCANHASHYHARAHRRREALVSNPWAHAAEPSIAPVDWLDGREVAVGLWSVPAWARQILLLAAVGHGVTEIARMLRVPIGTAATRMRRARRLLRGVLARGGG